MRIGILSDSHGYADRTGAAVHLLLDQGAELLLHLGDFEEEEVLDELAGHPARIVFGNCDRDLDAMRQFADSLDIAVDDPLGRLDTDAGPVMYTHGHLDHCLREAVDAGARYILHGHTHERRDEVIDGIRYVNPGALFRATTLTVAILDTDADTVEFLEVAKSTT